MRLARIAAAAGALAASAANAQTPAAQPAKEIKWILSAGAGGGYSAYAQAFAPYLSAHLPGRPSIVIQNMPGAGGLRAMQYLSGSAPKDGSVIGLVHSSVPFAPLFDMPGASFDPRAFGWIGSMNSANEICAAWHTSGIRTWRDMLEKEFIVGGTGGGSQMETMPDAFNRIFGTKMRIISGYNSGGDVYLAMERGEVMGRCGASFSSLEATRPDWLATGKVSAPVLIGLRRNSAFPGVPAIVEMAGDERTRQTLEVLLAYQDMDRPILAPPGIPAEKLASLRGAFHAAMSDAGFIAEAKRLRIEIEEISGERLEKSLAETFALPRARIEDAKAALSGAR